MKRTSWVNRLLMGLIGFLFVAGIVFSSFGSGGQALDSSVSSSEPEGHRAVFLLLEDLGFNPRPWRQAPLVLPQDERVLWMPRIPMPLTLEEAADDPDPEHEAPLEEGQDSHSGVRNVALLEDPRHPANYGEFVRGGGTLILPFESSHLDWLRNDCGLEIPDWEACDWESGGLLAELETGERLALGFDEDGLPNPRDWVVDLSWDSREHEARGWHDLAWAADGRPFASWMTCGRGKVVLLADASFIRNDRLGLADNALVCVRLFEALDQGAGLYFDEFALGLWLPRSKASLALSPGVFEVVYHSILVLLLFVLVHAWTREFPRDPLPTALDPRSRVRSQARLFERAKRYDLLGRDLQLGCLRRIVKLEGIPLAGRVLGEGVSEEVTSRLAVELAERLRQDPARWRAAFGDRNLRNAKELEALGHELTELESYVLDRRAARSAIPTKLASSGSSATNTPLNRPTHTDSPTDTETAG